ncbi:MAG TPA: sugar phosphate isomerase/epimerase [Candidatus Hydrogenedentes bacterium]|nr:sugar phosphate isomerase/epimerase [Candidatus Hydrogenedentota bacterium]
MADTLDRRHFLASAAGAAAMLSMPKVLAQTPAPAAKRYQENISPWPLALNSSTIRPTPLLDKIRIAAETGWDAIELWVNELDEYEKGGGDLKDLGKQINDRGLFVPNIIGLWECMPATADAFEKSLEATRSRMRMSAAVGSTFVAAIPAPDRPDFDLKWGADRYRDLLKIGREEFGITVAVEFVGFMKGVHRIGQACAIALDADDPTACLIADTFHLYRGASGFNGLKHIQGSLIADFHWNDVPGDVPREQMGDEHRIYPGDGILPLTQALQDLKAIGFTRTLSLEMFNREHWKMDPKVVAQTGLQKMHDCIAKAKV